MPSFSNDPIVSLLNTSIYQDGVLVLHGLNFEISKGEFVYLIGKTGSGKTSLLKTLYADLENPKGKISVAGYQVDKIKREKVPFLRRKIGIIFQDFQLLNDRTVHDNLLFVLKATGWKEITKMKARVSEILMRVGLDAVASKFPHQLSGGEQQRTVIARALLNEPEILIADEPTGNLDPEVADEIMKLFLEINKSGTAIFMATHNLHFLEKYPARTLKIQHGTLQEMPSAAVL
ncbi:MAG: ATP-binding cassette domain-containing protein [Cytophagaceae bacterium]|jgi:cell division transport system ATP-binding protein|nr:ATP-binding cassette domain-containing protein [Cytophagaceae bacterium]